MDRHDLEDVRKHQGLPEPEYRYKKWLPLTDNTVRGAFWQRFEGDMNCLDGYNYATECDAAALNRILKTAKDFKELHGELTKFVRGRHDYLALFRITVLSESLPPGRRIDNPDEKGSLTNPTVLPNKYKNNKE